MCVYVCVNNTEVGNTCIFSVAEISVETSWNFGSSSSKVIWNSNVKWYRNVPPNYFGVVWSPKVDNYLQRLFFIGRNYERELCLPLNFENQAFLMREVISIPKLLSSHNNYKQLVLRCRTVSCRAIMVNLQRVLACFPELHFGMWLPWTAFCLCGLSEGGFDLHSVKTNCKNTFKSYFFLFFWG